MFRPKEEAKPYRYFDSPDGEDVFRKLWAVWKPTAMVALGASTVDIMMYSHPKGYMKALGRVAHVSAPLFGMATAFVIATNVTARIRGKDDKINWFIGGAAAGVTLGAWSRSSVGVVFGGFAFGIAAMIKKAAIETNFVFFPPITNRPESGVWLSDVSLIKPRPGNWSMTEAQLVDEEAKEGEEDDDDDDEELLSEDFIDEEDEEEEEDEEGR